MQHITLNNYEAFLLDFCDGNLSESLCSELEVFLIINPQLNLSLSSLTFNKLECNTTPFLDKDSLKKTESNLVSETQLVAYIENQLSEKEKLTLEKNCALNPDLAKQLSQYKHTIAQPNLQINYPHKNKLKRKSKIIWLNFSLPQYSVAAFIVFIIGLLLFWNLTFNTAISPTKTIANNNLSALKNKTRVIDEKNTMQQHIKKIEQKLSVNKSNSNQSRKKTLLKKLKTVAPIIINQQQLPAIANVNDPINNNLLINNADSINSNVQKSDVVQLSNKNNKHVSVIIETDDEDLSTTTVAKTSFWALASNALKNVNSLGAKNVNGSSNKLNYNLNVGGLSIQHKLATKL